MQAYINAAGLPFANEGSLQNYIRSHRSQAEQLLQAADGDLARAVLAVENLTKHYISEEKRNFSMAWIVKDYPEWDKERIEYEQKENIRA